jgi:acyl-CoA dehydrogenase
MEFGDTKAEAAFRLEASTWLAFHRPDRSEDAVRRLDSAADPASVDDLDRLELAHLGVARNWQHTLCDAGWAGITWPAEYGGRGGTGIEQEIFNEELAAYQAPSSPLHNVSIGMVGPTLIAHGSDEQKSRHLTPILRGDEIWCQLFSEPGAGSDLAGLSTRAKRTDGGWIVNGQKVWTTGARLAHYGALLARTDGSVPKHRGLTYFILDMSTPGIQVRPLRQITGDSDFNEVFLTDVRVPDDAVVGEVNGGWAVANTMLLSERANFSRANTDFDEVVELARVRGHGGDPAIRQEIAKVYAADQAIRLLRLEARTALSKGTTAPLIASVTKLLSAQRYKRITRLALDLLGADGLAVGASATDTDWHRRYLMAPVGRIAGGTDEVQKNIIGERFLGLPREARRDKERAFDDTSRL